MMVSPDPMLALVILFLLTVKSYSVIEVLTSNELAPSVNEIELVPASKIAPAPIVTSAPAKIILSAPQSNVPSSSAKSLSPTVKVVATVIVPV